MLQLCGVKCVRRHHIISLEKSWAEEWQHHSTFCFVVFWLLLSASFCFLCTDAS